MGRVVALFIKGLVVMSIRTKAILLAGLPALLIFLVITFFNVMELHSVVEKGLEANRISLMDAEKRRLQHVVETSVGSVKNILNDNSLSTEQKKTTSLRPPDACDLW